jgi:hypothetical protein
LKKKQRRSKRKRLMQTKEKHNNLT